MKIIQVNAIPLSMPIAPGEHRTWWGDYPSISIVLVEVVTDEGIKGYGEGLARYCPQSYAMLVEKLLAPQYIGKDPFEVESLWQRAFRSHSGKSGGMLMEAISAIDIALWDIMGKALNQPIHRLLGTCGRTEVDAYASSISWNAEDKAAEQVEAATRQGFKMIKVKLGAPADDAIAWCRKVRDMVRPDIKLCADANFAYSLDEAIKVANALHELDFYWFEEPLIPEDIDGYKRLRTASPMMIVAGESEHTSFGARELIASRSVGMIQPDCTRAGGITETRKIANTAYAFNVGYAPHIGGGGAVSAAANLQLSAAMPNFVIFESMIFPSALRDELATEPVGSIDLKTGKVNVPQGPGLGIELDFDVVDRLRSKG
ncbi:mandelate racemase/muconate lactonizing enzyme family protein [Aureimonas fodinaquatilis]|uniref:Mandelate racemase/muconate lactonizing enzyme family protein n=1 Tax=Aureimonas fodinaquatilis TaxID=2565783 RepID=A0A5B0E093_9HYPH|nr:mandelate racemase/muconate lactonizing enzyme family protein [Aureimonas fodinaquatilis]KAA0971180.1 mandelate racemase/muconate lactonizing enzyme family protein [Aureimonas fodinaquatilis]